MSKKTKKDENGKPVNTGQTAADKEIEEEKEISKDEQPEKQEQVNISEEAEKEDEEPESDSEKEEKTSLLSSIKSLFVMPEAKDEVKTQKVIVQTGLETDYYIEVISDEIKEGDKVKVPDGNDSDGSADVAAMEVVPETDDASGNEEAEDTSEGVSAGAGGF